MPRNHFDIRFTYPLEGYPSTLLLTATVTWSNTDHCDSLEDIRLPGSSTMPVMPPVSLQKSAGKWVHPDSESASLLSENAGAAIDAEEAS